MGKLCTHEESGLHMIKTLLSVLVSVCLLIDCVALAGTEAVPPDRFQRHQKRIFVPLSDRPADFQPATSAEKVDDFSDVKISETVSPATFSQRNSSIAYLGDGRTVIVWQDDRSGSYKIYAQLLDSNGLSVSSNSLLAGRTDGYNLIEPAAVAHSSGGFFVAWRDEISGRIYAARYDDSLTQIIAPFAINDVPVMNFAGPFDIAFAESLLVVVWEDYGSSNDIALRVFSPTGNPYIYPVGVNTDTGDALHWVPSIAMDGAGTMGVVWEDYRSGNPDIFFQLVNLNGTLNGPNLAVVQGAFSDSAQILPEIAYSSRDGYAISWLDQRDGPQKVYLQRYQKGSGLVGSNVKISGDDALAIDWDTDMDVSSSGDLKLAWSSVDEADQILLQKFSTGFVPDGDFSTVNSYLPGSRWEASMRVGISDKLVCTWTDFRSGNADIYFQLLSSDGSQQLAEDMMVNDDPEGAASIEPDIKVIDDTKGMIVFTDMRNDGGDIYMQLVGSDGVLIGVNQKVNTDTFELSQNEPALAISSEQAFVVWKDTRPLLGATGPRIFGRYSSLDGVFSLPDFLISDSGNISPKSNPAVAMTPDGSALVAWIDYRYDTAHVFGRHLNPDGTPSGEIFLISSLTTDLDNADVHVDVDGFNIFTIAWLSEVGEGASSVVASRYSSGGAYIDRFTYPSDVPGVEITDISAAVNNEGDLWVYWEGAGAERRLYLSRISNEGVIINPGENIALISSAIPLDPDVDVDEGGIVITSFTYSNFDNRQVYYQLYASNGLSEPLLASTFVPEFMASSTVAGFNHKAWVAWSDPREGGLNIYLSQNTYQFLTDIEEDKPDVLPKDFVLKQNYPNPFNPSTAIEFDISTRSRVEISVYNLLGQEILILTDKVYDPGNYSIPWDGTDAHGRPVPTGMYLYRMKAGENQHLRKMLLIK